MCMGAHWERPESLHEPRKDVVRGVTPEARRHAFCPAWRTWDRHYGIGPPLRADGLLRPIQKYIALDLPGLQPPVWTFYWGDGPEWGLTKQPDGPKSARAPTLFVSLHMGKQNLGRAREGGNRDTVQAVYPPESSSASRLHTCPPDKRRRIFAASPRAAPTGGGPTHPPHWAGFCAFRLLRPKQVWVCNNLKAEPL